jgi:hypothetical protein
VPSEIRVSIVAVAWRRFAHAARWNGHAPQTTTGVASWSASHCQFSNCSGGIIESTRTGSVSAAEMTSRRRSGAVGSGSRSAAAGSALGSTAW